MTSLYSSTAEPKRVFGEGQLLKVFYQTMETMAPGAWALNHALQTLWQPGALSHDWTLPDNFHVHVKVTAQITEYVQFLDTPVPVTLEVNQGTKKGRSISPNTVHSIDGMIVREMTRRCSYDQDKLGTLMEALMAHDTSAFASVPEPSLVDTLWGHYLNSGFLSVRILDVLTKDNLHLVDIEVIKALVITLPEKPFDVISIHDCFRCLPSYGNDLRRQYNQILSDIAKSDLLSFLASQITGRHLPAQKRGGIHLDILEADYAIC